MKISIVSSRSFLPIAGGIVVAVVAGAASMALAQAVSAPTCTVSISPSIISSGQSATLSWTSSGATDAMFDQGLGQTASPSGGSMTVSPLNTMTYTGTFTGAYGSTTCQTTVTVSPLMAPATTTGNLFPIGNAIVPTASATTTTVIPTVTTGISTATAPASSAVPMLATAPAAYPAVGATPAPMVMTVGSGGNILLRAPVKLVGMNLIVVDGWGGPWIIRAGASTRVLSNTPNVVGDVSAISVGDFVGIAGTIASDQIYTVDAVLIRDWTTNPYVAPAATTTATTTTSSIVGEPLLAR